MACDEKNWNFQGSQRSIVRDTSRPVVPEYIAFVCSFWVVQTDVAVPMKGSKKRKYQRTL
jgi:hypothetical protein